MLNIISKPERSKSKSFIYRGCVILSVILYLGLVQCRSTEKITEYTHFNQLEEGKKIEYKYSLTEGIKYRLLGDFSRAVYFLNRATEIFPLSDVAHYELSNIYLRADMPEETVHHGIRAVEIDTLNIWYYYNIAEIYRNFPEYDGLIRILESGCKIFSEDFRLHYELSQILYINKQFELAIILLEKVEDFAGINERTSMLKHSIYMEQGKFEKGHIELLALVEEFPDEPRYYGLLAEFFASIEMNEEALLYYKKVFEIDPDNGTAQLSVADFYIMNQRFEDAFYYLVTAFNNQSVNLEEKIQFFSVIIVEDNLVNNYSEKIKQLGLLLEKNYPEQDIIKVILSDFYIRIEEYSEASSLIKDLYAKDKANEKIAEQLLTVLAYSSDYAGIIEYGADIHEHFPENIIIMYFIGIANHLLDNIQESIYIFEKAIDSGIKNLTIRSQIFSFLGENYNKINDFSKSDEFFEKAIELDPDNYISLNNYAYYLALRGERLEKALEYSRITLEYEPDNSSFLDTFAWILFKMDRIEEAYEYIKLAYRFNGAGSYDIVVHYARILIELERFEESIEFLEKASELTNDSGELDELFLFVEDVLK